MNRGENRTGAKKKSRKKSMNKIGSLKGDRKEHE